MHDQDERPASHRLLSRRRLLASAWWMGGAVTVGRGSWVVGPAWGQANPIKVGIATDLTGPIGFAGNANANVAKMVVNDINAKGGVLGRSLQLFVEDTASNESMAVNNVRKLIQRDRVDVVFGGITSSMRNAIKDVIVTRGRTLYIYPQLYEGQECTPFIFCTGPTPAQQCDEFIPWLIKNGGKRFAFPSANYICPSSSTSTPGRWWPGTGARSSSRSTTPSTRSSTAPP
jgi:ABC-type branched-subunit amino acid transport system substrate-binding protein